MRTKAQQFDTFNKDVILLPNPSWDVVCRQGPKLKLHKHGHVLSAFEFLKAWDNHTVVERIREGFGDHIPKDVSFQFMMACGNKLVLPKLQQGQELNGMLIHKVYKTKTLYVRPSKTLLNDSEEEYEHNQTAPTTNSSEDDCDEVPQIQSQCTTSPAAPLSSLSKNEDGNPGTCSNDEDTTSIKSQGVDQGDCLPGTSGQTVDSLATSSHDDYSSYLSLVSMIPDESSDDDDLNQAIIASLETPVTKHVPIKEILLELSNKINTQQCKFNVKRSAVWDGAVRGFRRVSYSPNSMIWVKFSDDMGKNEEGVDLGGPKREFLRLLMESIAVSPMFEGKENSKNLALNSTALREDWYFTVGRAIAVSLVHGGPPPNFFSPTLFTLLVDGSANPVLEEIADNELQEKVKKVSESTNLEELEKSQAPLLDYLANAGCLRLMKSLRDKDMLVHDIVMFQIIHRVQGPFYRFCEGLKTLGVLEKIRSHPDSFRPLFCYEPSIMTADQMDDLFRIRLSPEGSNKRASEEMVVTFWRDYLQDAEEEEGPSKLQKILAFATGASVVPPIGFSPVPSVQFMHKDDDDDFFSPMFLMANTCINCIKLPLHASYQLFREKFDFALGNTYGFGRA